MAEYTNDLRIKEIGIGEEAGAWGTTLNTQLGLLAEGFSYGVENLASDANATITMADGASDEARSLYLKITSTSLSATRTVTLAPQSVSKVWIIENATTGSQSITITQGEGQHGVTIPNGQVKVVYSTGDSESPSGVYDAFDDLNLDGGAITAANGITSTAAANSFGATSFNDADITNVGSISLDSIVSDTSPGAIQINSGGDKLRIDGTVGIGTDAHDSQALHILSSAYHVRLENAGSPGEIGLIGLLDDGQLDIWAHGGNSTDIITFRTGTSTGTERLRVANDGKILIGHNVNVGQAGVAPTLQVHGTGSATSSISATRNSNDTGGPYLILSKSRGTSTGATTVVQANDILGQIMFAGADGGDLAPVGASIQALVDTTPGTNDMPGRLVFSTTVDGAQTATERMRIQNSGITQFKTGDGQSGIAEFHTNASTGNTTGYISIRPQGTAKGYIGNGSSLLSGANVGDFIFRSENNAVINSGGNSESIRADNDGAVTLNKQPSFMARGLGQSNLANGTQLHFPSDNEIIDRSADYNGTSSVFTAPNTGIYNLSVNIRLISVTADASYIIVRLVTSNRSYDWIWDPRGGDQTWDYVTATINVLADMDASDTAYVYYYQSGGTFNNDTGAGVGHFSGYLVA